MGKRLGGDQGEHQQGKAESGSEQHHRLDATPGQTGRQQANQDVGGQHGDAHAGHVVGGGCAAVAVHLHQPGNRPQALHGHEATGQRQAEGHETPEVCAAEHRLDAGELGSKGFRFALVVLFRNAEEQPDGDGESQAGQGEEDLTPAGNLQGNFKRRRGRQCPKAARSHDPAGQRSLSRGRKPQGKRLERGHQACRNSESDQTAADRQFSNTLTEGKSRGASGGNQQQPGFDTARAKTVEKHAERQLCGSEREEVGARQQAQSTRVKGEFLRQYRTDDRIGRPVEIRKEVGACEGQEQLQPQHARDPA